VKRDFEILEKILIACGNAGGLLREVKDVGAEEFRFHVLLLEDIGLVASTGLAGHHNSIFRLTYKGHDAFEALENAESINWNNLAGCHCR
jgi:hypothetical protein